MMVGARVISARSARESTGKIRRQTRGYRIAQLVVLSILIYLIAGPLLMTLVASFKEGDTLPTTPGPLTFENIAEVYGSGRTYRLLLNSTIFAVGAVAMAMVISCSIAWIVERTNFRWRRSLYVVTILPMAVPGMLYAIAWTYLLSPEIGVINRAIRSVLPFLGADGPFDVQTLYGMILVEGLRLVPTMFLMITAAMKFMDPSLEEASYLSGAGLGRTLGRISLPLMTPALLGAGLFFLIIAIEAFEVPGILGMNAGVPVLATEIYFSARPPGGLPEYGLPATYATLLVIIVLVMLYAYRRVTASQTRYAVVRGKGYRPNRRPIRRFGGVVTALCLLYVIVSFVLPIAVLVWSSLHPVFVPITLENIAQVDLAAWSAVLGQAGFTSAAFNTLVLTLVSATALTALALAAAWAVVRMPGRLSGLIDVMAFMPVALPGIAIGLALMLFYLSVPAGIYGTIWIMVIAIITKFMSYAARTSIGGVLQIHPELEEAGRVSGGRLFENTRRILLPLVLPVLANLWVWIAVHAVREISTTVLLYAPGTELLATMVWSAWVQGNQSTASVIGVMMVIVSAALVYVSRFMLKRSGGEVSA